MIICKTYKREDVEEGLLWERDFAPFFELPPNIRNIAHHGFTEIANNAHDHSDGKNVSIIMCLKDGTLSILVADDGIGIFRKIQNALNLPDPRLSLLELSKGKLTTDSSKHPGKGIFFSFRMFDTFIIKANGLAFQHDIRVKSDVLFEEPYDMGTSVFMAIAIDSTKISKEVFDEFSVPKELSFSKTIVPVRLASIGGENLISRSQAKRLVSRLDAFKTVILDLTKLRK